MARRKAASSGNPLTRIATTPEQAEQLRKAGLVSAFEIARHGVDELARRVPGLGGDEARSLHQRACALAIVAARQLREQRLTARDRGNQAWRTGIQALVEGPTFDSQFSPSWGDNCLPGSIEATTSPAAYLTALYQWATQVIEPQADATQGPITLAQRRPDLAALVLDNHSLERVEPTLGIVNGILESAARQHLDDHNEKTRSVDDALLEARYPFSLPFERYLSQINVILSRKAYGLGDLVRELDPEYPYFSRDGLHSQRSDDALQMDIPVGPEQRALLLEAPYFPRGVRRASARSVQTRTDLRTGLREPVHGAQAAFFMRHYGVESAADLEDMTAFCLRTGLDQDGVESLLSIERHAPVGSPNVPGLADASPARFGSVYINAGQEPSAGIVSNGGQHSLVDASNDHYDRMQRMVRLARWLDLPFGDADRLIAAALVAEHGAEGQGAPLSENTLRALGLFYRIRRDYKVSAEDFAALLDGLALYGRGSERSQFDRVFNDPALFSEPLVLDGAVFNIVPASDAELRKINHLCSALGISFESYLYVARYIAQAYAEESLNQEEQIETLHWSPLVVSAFYRLARLPTLLGLSCIETLALLQLIGQRGHQYVTRLVRTRLATYQHSALSDTLSVIQSLTDTVQWCRDSDLSVNWLYQHLIPLAPVAAASDRELDLLKQINGRMRPTLISNDTFRDAGMPMVAGVDIPKPIDWLKELNAFVSAQGLIFDLPEHPTGEAYEAALKARLDTVVGGHELPDGPHVVVRAFQLVMEARSAQQSLVWESLANTLGGLAEQCQTLLIWGGGSSYQLLEEVLRLFDGSDPEPLPIPVGDEVLALFSRLTHRMGIVSQLGLSPLALRSWLNHRDWFEGPGATDSGEVTFADLHLLVQYRHVLEFARQAEQAVLDYLKLVNSLPPDLTEQDLQLIREDAAGKIAQFTGFGIRDILETVAQITGDGIILSVRQLAHLIRVRQACTTLQLGTRAALDLSRLSSNSAREAYRAAAQSALGSLTEHLDGVAVPAHGELGQSEASWIVVDTQLLVAQAGGKARCVLTVKNFLGQPMPNITVTWHTSLSTMGTPSSTSTDEYGRVENHLLAGDEMGTAQVIARFGLDRQILAPLIQIDCDEGSLYFRDLLSDPQEALAGNLQPIRFDVQMLDIVGNPGRDRVIEWSTDLGAFERPQTRTDANGFSSAWLRSQSSGIATVVIDYRGNGEQESFEPVEFLEQPYFQYVRFSGPVASTQEVEAVCRIVNLDGSPVEGATVDWSADFGGFVDDPAQSVTDARGIARIGYLSEEAGEVRLTVDATLDGHPLRSLSSELVPVYELPRLVYMAPPEQDFVLFQPAPARFEVTLHPAAAGYPVTWWAGVELLETTSTDHQGHAAFLRHFTPGQVGEQTITVRSVREDDSFDFKVTVVKPHEVLTIRQDPDDPGIVSVVEEQNDFAVDPGLASRVIIRAPRSDGSGDDDCRLTITLGNGADPDDLGITFNPPLGQTVNCDSNGEVVLEIDCTRAAFLPNSDPNYNAISLEVKSNLSVTAPLRLRLRDLLDISKSDLHLFYMGSSNFNFEIAILCGRLRRRNGDAPVALRPDRDRLLVKMDGGGEEMETPSLSLAQEGLWLQSMHFQTPLGSLEPSGSVWGIETIIARIHFVESGFSFEEFLPPPTVTITHVENDGVIAEDNWFYVDHGGVYDFVINVSNADGPLANLPLMEPEMVDDGVVYRCDGITDADGNLLVSADTRGAKPGARSNLFYLFGAATELRVVEFVVTVHTLEPDLPNNVLVKASFKRRNDQSFTSAVNWHGWFKVDDGDVNNFIQYGDYNEVKAFSISLPNDAPAVITIGLSSPTASSRLLAYGNPITIPGPSQPEGDAS